MSHPDQSAASPAAPPRPPLALRAWSLSLAAAVAVAVLDQVTKNLAVARLTPGQPREVIGSLLRLHLLYNPGAAFSLGESATLLLTILAAAAVATLTWLLRRRRPTPLRVALTLLLAGAAGNLCDRLFRAPGPGRGHVVDFLQLPHWPVFNVADIAITTAGVLLALCAVFPRRMGLDEPAHRDVTSDAPIPAPAQATAGNDSRRTPGRASSASAQSPQHETE